MLWFANFIIKANVTDKWDLMVNKNCATQIIPTVVTIFMYTHEQMRKIHGLLIILPSSRLFGPLAVALLLCIIVLLIPLEITAVDVIVVDVDVVSTVFVVTGMIRDVLASTFVASGMTVDDSETEHELISNKP